jgi:hypothetical protein
LRRSLAARGWITRGWIREEYKTPDVTVNRLARILAIGGIPGRVYEAPEFTQEGAAPPPASAKG